MGSPLSPSSGSTLNANSITAVLSSDLAGGHEECSQHDKDDDLKTLMTKGQMNPLNSSTVVDSESTNYLSSPEEEVKPINEEANVCTKEVLSVLSPRSNASPTRNVKRFPVKPQKIPENIQVQTDTLRGRTDFENESNSIHIFEDSNDLSEHATSDLEHEDATYILQDDETGGYAGMDDTAYSNFSAVPDMTMFAKIGHSPSKSRSAPTPQRQLSQVAEQQYDHDCPPSPTPPGKQKSGGNNTTNLILDFTEQFESITRQRGEQSPLRGASRYSPSKRASFATSLTSPPAVDRSRFRSGSPNHTKMSNLLDFDIPPAPTPRSMPSITPRELESLKSNFMSEISSLRASLSGKEAEVKSLKSAIGDAENRVGESMEQFREERILRERLAAEAEDWKNRGQEMEAVLRDVKTDIINGERERNELEGRLDECEKRREAAEMMAQEAESKIAALRSAPTAQPDQTLAEKNDKRQEGNSGKDVEVAVERVAKELHTLYKSKHESKVAALRKSYENRWEKRVKDLESTVEKLSKENDDLRLARDATMSGVVPRVSEEGQSIEIFKSQMVHDAKITKELEAKLEGLGEELTSIKKDNSELRQHLENERIEKGELVAAVEEMISLQNTFALPSAMSLSAQAPELSTPGSGVETFRSSLQRASGLRAPSSGITGTVPHMESRIGRAASTDRSKTGNVQATRPASGSGTRYGIMNSIEKMGGHRG